MAFRLCFFHRCWDQVGDNFCRLAKDFFWGILDLWEINKTSLVLILKVNRPKSFTQFSLISLCNVIYKVIAKLIVNRLFFNRVLFQGDIYKIIFAL